MSVIKDTVITFDGNRVWWVLDLATVYPWWSWQHDRPCDDCSGDPLDTIDHYDCPGCGVSGRHTFEIEVETDDWQCPVCLASFSIPIGASCRLHDPRRIIATYRVSVVPGMVLPITDRNDYSPTPLIFIDEVGNAYLYDPAERINIPIIFPPDAKPGAFAVQLEVHA